MTVVRNQVNSQDVWQIAQVNYSPDHTYVRSTDGHGNYDQLRNVKITPALHAVLMEVIARGDLPDYRTVSDFVRDALVHRLWYIQNGNAQIAQAVNAEIIASEIATKIARNQSRTDMIRLYSEQLSAFDQDGDWTSIVEALDSMSVLIDEWDDTRHGRELASVIARYAETVRRRQDTRGLHVVD
jgi:hypothetical protein